MNINDKDLKKAEKVLKKKCAYIDWRYDNYYFGENYDTKLSDCTILDSKEIMNLILDNNKN